jgi:hypothetical protein
MLVGVFFSFFSFLLCVATDTGTYSPRLCSLGKRLPLDASSCHAQSVGYPAPRSHR